MKFERLKTVNKLGADYFEIHTIDIPDKKNKWQSL